jgi:hypothetical protein
MGLLDKLKGKAQEIINDPETKAKIQKLAEEKGITLDAAKAKFLNKKK